MTTVTVPEGRARPLTPGELAAAKAVAAAAGLLGVLGFANSFRAVSHAAQASFGVMAPTVPVGIDVAIAVFSAMDIVLARLDMRPRWVRLIPWALTGATIYLNIAGQPTWFGRVAHAVFPALWVIAVSLAAHVVRVRAHLASGTAIDRIRASRWMLAPVPTARLWRRMVLWEIRSYPAALDRERARVLALTGLQDEYGLLAWRWRAPRRVRALYRLGEHESAVTASATPGGQAGHDEAGTGDDGRGVPEAVREARTVRALRPGDRTDTARTDDDAALADRDAAVAMITEEIRAAIEAGERWHPNYPALMQATGRRLSFCEKAVKAARLAVFDTPAQDRTDKTILRTDESASSRTDDARTEDGADGDDRLVLAGANGHMT